MKNFFLILLFYAVSLFQTSFLIHFSFFKFLPNFILIAFLLFNIFENPQKNKGLWAAFAGGFFWDIFSSKPIGFHILILFVLAVFMKLILRNYFFIHLRPKRQFGNIHG